MNEALRKLIEARQAIWSQMQTILTAAGERRSDSDREAGKPPELTADEQQTYERLDGEFETLDAQIKAETRRQDQAASVQEGQAALLESEGRAVAAGAQQSGIYEERALPTDPDERDAVIQDRDNDELRRYLRGGMAAFTPEQRAEQEVRGMRRLNLGSLEARQVLAAMPAEQRALSHVTNTAGEYLISEQWFNRVIVAMQAFGGMRRSRASILRTATGEQMHLPTVNDTSNTGNILAENTEVGETDIVLAEKVLDAYLVTSDLIRVPVQLLQDASYDVGGLLARLLAERVGRKSNALYTTGTGSSQPNGAVVASTEGKEAASASVITYLEMLDLKFSVDPAYWADGQGEWMFNSTSLLKAIKKLLDGDNRPIFQPNVQTGRIDRIDGDPFVINTDMADIAASAKVMLYGDFSLFFIRDVLDMQLIRLNERFAEFLQVGFMSYLRTDSELGDAGTAPIKHYVMAAS